jgi:UDP-N-acetylglucosamine 2-epimerase
MSVVGARPNFVKLAPLDKELVMKGGINHQIVHTGQHYDYLMSEVFFDELYIPAPKWNLGLPSEKVGQMVKGLQKLMVSESPDIVLVYGDTDSTLAGALAASKQKIKLAHVESGLRCFNIKVPEERNRLLIDAVSDILFCPSWTAVHNLFREGKGTKDIRMVGDLMIQSLRSVECKLSDTVLVNYRIAPKSYVLVTIHRQENADERKNMRAIIDALVELGKPVIFSLHPRTKKNLERWNMMEDLAMYATITSPLRYLDFLSLEKYAKTILTDSGGVQKEAYYFGVPCVTVRGETEWVETVRDKWNTLVPADKGSILSALSKPVPENEPSTKYGDDGVAKRIVDVLTGVMA